tara:strand:- start:354 stop:500 length:147 start_codon:yes stop_codon:yes gene_type:complete
MKFISKSIWFGVFSSSGLEEVPPQPERMQERKIHPVGLGLFLKFVLSG